MENNMRPTATTVPVVFGRFEVEVVEVDIEHS